MENQIIFLTEQDKAILRSYLHIAEGIAEFWGESCEVIVHNLAQLDASVIKIINGRSSGQQEGSPISDAALTYAHKMMADPSLRHITYFSKTKRGESYKSVVCAIEGAHQNIIGLLCVNFYMTAPFHTLLQTFSPVARLDSRCVPEIFVENSEELMLSALAEAKRTVYGNLSISSANKNKEIISLLHQKGIFNLKDSVVTIASHLGISKNTVYMHIRNMYK